MKKTLYGALVALTFAVGGRPAAADAAEPFWHAGAGSLELARLLLWSKSFTIPERLRLTDVQRGDELTAADCSANFYRPGRHQAPIVNAADAVTCTVTKKDGR